MTPSSTLAKLRATLEIMDTMADRIAALMREARKSRQDLIGETGLTKQAVSFLLRGDTTPEKLRASTALALARSLNTTVSYIVEGRGPRHAPTGDPRIEALISHFMAAPENAKRALELTASALADGDAPKYTGRAA